MVLLDKKDRPRIIVIGAGIAGIIAARQLQYFGFETIILEGRVRAFLERKDQFSFSFVLLESRRGSNCNIS
jgi:2-polyprenyl-6-methoxyphenol hydroxylase-like FAD-dependent oxidoreductase